MAPLLHLRDVALTFGGQPLLEAAEIAVSAGERVCLVGRNGSGKSTLLKIAAGLVEPDHADRFVQPDGGSNADAGSGTAYTAESAATSGPIEAYAALLEKRAAHAIAGTFDSRWKSWGAAYGSTANVDGDEAVVGSHNLDIDTYGLAAGAGWSEGDFAFGAALGGGHSSFDLDGGLGSGDAGIFHAGV